MKPSICTYTGIEFDLLNPKPSMVRIEDIIHSHSLLNRFTGHTRVFYSLAQHDCLVHALYPHILSVCHDFPEAYIGDVSKPLKMLLPDYREVEYRITETVSEAFEIDLINLPQEVKEADYFALKIEQYNFMPITDWWDIDEKAMGYKLVAQSSQIAKNRLTSLIKSYKPEWFKS